MLGRIYAYQKMKVVLVFVNAKIGTKLCSSKFYGTSMKTKFHYGFDGYTQFILEAKVFENGDMEEMIIPSLKSCLRFVI